MRPTIRFLVGDRLFLRPLETEDMPTCQVWINDPEIRPYLAAFRPMDAVSEAAWHASHDRGMTPRELHFGIALLEGDRLIGTTSLMRIDWLHRSATSGSLIGARAEWGKGYGTEAKHLLLEYAFRTLNLHRVHSEVIAYNERSARHLLRNGYLLEGRRREAAFRDGRYHDVLDYGVLRADWEARRAAGSAAER